MGKIATFFGVILLTLAAGSLVLVTREVTSAIRMGGSDGGYLGAYNSSAAIVDGVLLMVSGALGLLLIRRHLGRSGVRMVLLGTVALAVMWGHHASYMLLPEG